MTAPRRLLLDLDRIRTDGGTQARAESSLETVMEYAERLAAGEEFPPLVVFRDKAGEYWLASGFHRLEALRCAGRSHAACDVHEGELREARLFAAATNTRHGLRRSPADQRLAIWLVRQDEEGRTWPAERVARHCGVSAALVEAMDVSTAWAPPPGLFGPDEAARPPVPDRACEDPEITRERARRSVRKIIRFAERLGLPAEELCRQVLEEELARIRAREESRARRNTDRASTPSSAGDAGAGKAETLLPPVVDPGRRGLCCALEDGEPCTAAAVWWIGSNDAEDYTHACDRHRDTLACAGDRVLPLSTLTP